MQEDSPQKAQKGFLCAFCPFVFFVVNLTYHKAAMIEEKKVTDETQTISDIVPPIPRSKLEEDGHALLIVDLLRLPRTFSYRRYRIDVIGFLAAWLWVVLLLALGYWITTIGA